ncbi:MAG: roadblock/LC7 domain-containing protein [Methanoculleus sp.]|nr:roadblock/LC7 domain-containing protein [Methanoculleus sp.]
MIDKLPRGKAIGEMQAPLQWIFSHTSRFFGAVRITMQDGEGFLLVQNGEPLAAYFSHPFKSLSGSPALKSISSQEILDFSLWKYEPEDMQTALTLSAGAEAHLQPGRALPADRPEDGEPGPVAGTVEGREESSQGASPGEEPERLKAVLQNPGVTAAACFSDGLCIASVGDIDTESAVAFAEDLLRWSIRLQSAAPACGALVQMTIFYRDGNVIITPCDDNFLCIFTTPAVHLGQVRRMIRDLQSGAADHTSG